MKPASTHNRFVSLTINGVAAVQCIGYFVALTAATIVLGFLSPPILKSTGEINYPDRPVEELIIPVKLVPIPCPSQMLPQNCVAHMAIIIYLANNLLNVCPLYTLMTLATPKFVEKVKTGEPRDFYLGHLGLLLNIRRVDKRKSEIETKLDPVTFAATEGQLGEKVRWMKEEATRVMIQGFCKEGSFACVGNLIWKLQCLGLSETEHDIRLAHVILLYLSQEGQKKKKQNFAKCGKLGTHGGRKMNTPVSSHLVSEFVKLDFLSRMTSKDSFLRIPIIHF